MLMVDERRDVAARTSRSPYSSLWLCAVFSKLSSSKKPVPDARPSGTISMSSFAPSLLTCTSSVYSSMISLYLSVFWCAGPQRISYGCADSREVSCFRQQPEGSERDLWHNHGDSSKWCETAASIRDCPRIFVMLHLFLPYTIFTRTFQIIVFSWPCHSRFIAVIAVYEATVSSWHNGWD